MMPKKVSILLSALCLSAAAPTTVLAQEVGDFQLKTETRTNPENTPRPVFPVPSDRQLKWNETEFYAFFHYGMNTYTNLSGVTAMKRHLFCPYENAQSRTVAHGGQGCRHEGWHRGD